MKYLDRSFALILLGAVCLLCLSACEKLVMKPNPETDNMAVFEEYVRVVKEKYAMLEFKGVDIDFLGDSLRPGINNSLSEAELFAKLAVITHRLRDGHSSLARVPANASDTIDVFAGYDFLEGYPPGLDIPTLLAVYLDESVNPTIKRLEGGALGIRAMYGRLPQDNDIAYVWVPSWNEEISDEEIEQIFTDIKGSKGLVFDMRLNTGGDPSLATKFASYFTNESVYTGFERFKTGPATSDFVDSHVTLEPAESENRYLNPVMVLLDRFVYSAATTFSYSVDPIPQITFVGQRAGGGSGSVADGYLANGWHWNLSTSEFIDAKGRHLDDGFDPDIQVVLDTANKSMDEVLERAILELQ